MTSIALFGRRPRAQFAAATILACMSACVAWGALAFGANYPWAYWPLAAGCQLTGIAGLVAGQRVRAVSQAFAFTLIVIAVAILLQLTPLPARAVAAISPHTPDLVGRVELATYAGGSPRILLSVVPSSTWTAAGLYVSFALLLVGAVQVLSIRGVRRFTEALVVLGVFVALIGIIQRPLYSGRIYGFWQLQPDRIPFSGFVNRNHFAGWMLMVLPVTLSLFCAGVQRSMLDLTPGWRSRLLWLSSPEANRLILIGAGAAVMALALILTMSRSGVSALALSVVLTAWFIIRGLHNRPRKAAAIVYLLVVVVTVVSWAGVNTIFARFSETHWSEFNNRRGAWADAWSVAALFPTAGTGLNSYSTVSLFYQRHNRDVYFSAAHNDYLQLVAEGGLLLALPVLACMLVLGRDVRRRIFEDEAGTTSWWIRRGAVAGLIAVGFQETVDFSLQMPGNAALFALLCALALHRPPRRAEYRPVSIPSLTSGHHGARGRGARESCPSA